MRLSIPYILIKADSGREKSELDSLTIDSIRTIIYTLFEESLYTLGVYTWITLPTILSDYDNL